MARTKETPEQRKARTDKARATFAARFPDEESRRAYYKEMARRRWASDRSGESDAQDPNRPAGE